MKLRPYQEAGAQFLEGSDAALLADEMGLGKTAQVCTAARRLLLNGSVDRVLVIAPGSLLTNWENEFATWAPELQCRIAVGTQSDRLAWMALPIPVLLVSYDSIRSDYLSIGSEFCFDLIILDEAQRIKNSDSETALACRSLRWRRAWAVTGTPIENRIADLRSIFSFLKPTSTQSDMTADFLMDIASHCIRRRRGDVFEDLPPINRYTTYIDIHPTQRAEYNSLLRSSHPRSPKGVLETITALKQICNFGSDNASAKLDHLLSLCADARDNEQCVIVFSQYARTVHRIAEALVTPHVITGSIAPGRRQEVLEDFKLDTAFRPLLATYQSTAVGFNIPQADTVVLFDRWWNPSIEKQAIARALRFERKRPLSVVEFVCANTIELRIEQVLRDKQNIFRKTIDESGSFSEVDVPIDFHQALALERNHLLVSKES